MKKLSLLLAVLVCCGMLHAQSVYPGQHEGKIKQPLQSNVKAYAFDLKDTRLLNSPFKENMLKLTRHLFCWEADPKYADFYERALYNHILGQQDPNTGMVTYFLPLLPGAHKVYSTPDRSFWCCVGTGFENHAKYGEAIYYHTDNALYVNLFIPSELNWKEKGMKIRQETSFPEDGKVTLTIGTDTPAKI